MILIDYNGIAIANIVIEKLDIQEDLIRHMILNSIRLHRKRFHSKYGEIVICADGMNNWRYDAFPQYKANRKKTRRDSKIDWSEVFRLSNMVLEEIAENFPWKVIKIDEVEADDIIAQVAMNTQEFGEYEEVMIISADKDFAQLQKFTNVHQYSPTQKKFIVEENPKKQKLELILKGDQADGVPNVLSNDNCMVEGIRQSPLRQKTIDKLMDDPKCMGEEVYRNFLRNKKLIDLEELPGSLKERIINNFKDQDPWKNKGKVFPYLVSKRCRNLIDEIGDFI